MNHALSPGASPRAVTAALADLLRDASMEHHAHTLAAWGARSTADLEYLDEADFHDLGLPPIDGRKIRSLACAAMRSRGRRHSLPKPKRNTDWLPARWFVTNAQPQRSASQTPAAHTPATPKRPPCRRSSSQTPTVPPTPAAPPTPEAAPPIADAPPTPEARPRAATAPSPPPAALSPTASPRTVHFAVRGHSMVDLDVYDSDAESLGAAPADSAVIDDTLAATKAASAVDLAVGDDDDDDDVDFAVQDGESTWRTCPTIEFAVESAVESSNVVDMDFDICDDTSDDEPANAALTVTYVDDDGDDDDGDVVDFTLCDDDAPTPAASPRTVLLAVCDDVAPDARLDGGGARVPAGLLSSSHFDIPQRFARSGEARPRRRPPQSDVAADAGAKTAWLAWRVKKTADDCIDIDIVSPPRHPADRRASLSAVGAPDAAARALILTPPWDRARSRNDDSPCPPRRITYLTIADDEEPGAPDTDAGRGGAPWRPAESAAPNAEQPRTLAEDDVVSAKLCSEASDYAKGKENLRHIA
mmetsp:Transcript_14441/g.48345  ORF Transcript_14441/g.48345 Transcript_14441/m.48345 type:complete len:530 (+) Transcript_14441:204-1793(+)